MKSLEAEHIIGLAKDKRALVEVPMAQRVTNHYIGENFVTDFCHDKKGFFGFCCNPHCLADRAQLEIDGDTA